MGKKIKPGIYLESEIDNGYAALGFVKTMTKEIDTDYYLSSVIDYTYSMLSKDFDNYVNSAALSNPDVFRHVYEPGKVGIDQFKLWENTIYGRGRSKEVSFQWKPSVMPILTPDQRASNPNDPMSKVPDEIRDRLSDRKYVFRMQAPIMEYRIKTTVTPRYANFLFIPTFSTQYHRTQGRRSGGKREYAGRNYRLEKSNVPDWDYRNPQEPSGQGSTVGRFTGAWVGYWNGGAADQTWEMEIAPKIQAGIVQANREVAKVSKTRKTSKKSFSISTFNDSSAAFQAGANIARAFIRGKARSYSQAAKYIEREGTFNGEKEY